MNHPISNNPAREIVFSTFNNAKDNNPKAQVLAWHDFAAWLCTHVHTDVQEKTLLPAWSPAVYEPGRPRKNEHVKLISCLCYDVDHELITKEQAREKLDLLGYNYAISSSYSSTRDEPHWRLVLPLESPITPEQFQDVYHTVGEMLFTKNGYDHSTDDAARLWFQPYTPHIGAAFSIMETAAAFYRVEGAPKIEYVNHDDEDAIKLANYLAPDKTFPPEDVWEMLKFINPDEGHDVWSMTIFALQHNFQHAPDVGLEIAHEWSKASEVYDPAEINRMWSRPWVINPTTIGSLIHTVKQRGYKLPRKIEYGKYILKPIGSNYFKDTLPEPEWVIDDFMNRNTVAMLSGEGGVGKSMLTMQLAVAVSAGYDFLGYRVPQPMPVICLNAEDSFLKFNRRIRSYRNMLLMADALTPEQHAMVAENLFYYGAENPFYRLSKKEAGELINSINAIGQDRPLIIVDPLITFAAGDENDNNAMGEMIDIFRFIRNETDSSVMFVHHKGKSAENTYRGASALYDGVRQAYAMRQMRDEERQLYVFDDAQVHPNEHSGFVMLEHTKADEGERQGYIGLRRIGEGLLTRIEPVTDEQRTARLERVFELSGMMDEEAQARLAFVNRVREAVSSGSWVGKRALERRVNIRARWMGDEWAAGQAGENRVEEWLTWGVENGLLRRRPNGQFH